MPRERSPIATDSASSSGSYFTENRTYNSRVQLVELASNLAGKPLTNLKYNYTAGVNNGQAGSMTDVLSKEQTVYSYDSLKRLIKGEASVSLWGQSFGYDGWGNLFSKTPTAGHTGTTMSLSVDQTTNRVMATGFAYDLNGNMTSIPGTPQNIALSYDVENRTGGTWYDQQNQPLDRTGVWNEYGLHGERLSTWTYSAGSLGDQCQAEGIYLVCWPNFTATQVSRNIYFGGRLIQSNGTTVATDRLGSVRVDENGNKAEYYPYGETVSSSVTVPDLFGTYAREASGLDYANQRYYASVYGRFASPDPSDAGSNLQNPGTLNPYAYVVGDPVNQIDPRGLYACDPDSDPNCIDPGVNICNWNPYDPSCQWTGGSPSGATSGFLPVAAGVGGGILLGAGETVCILSLVCVPIEGVAVAAVAVTVAATVLISHPQPIHGTAVTDLPILPALPISQAGRLYTAIASCNIHPNGTPDHNSIGQVSGTGQGTSPALACSAAFTDAQAKVSAAYGVGYHAQHCRYAVSR